MALYKPINKIQHNQNTAELQLVVVPKLYLMSYPIVSTYNPIYKIKPIINQQQLPENPIIPLVFLLIVKSHNLGVESLLHVSR
jgi:hypothetical protein